MFAVIKTGGKQYKVAQDDVIVVEKLEADAGAEFVFDDVLMIGDGEKVDMGEPQIAGAQVVGEVVEQRRGAKVIIFKKRQRNTYRRKKGHRQHETVIKNHRDSGQGRQESRCKESSSKKRRRTKG